MRDELGSLALEVFFPTLGPACRLCYFRKHFNWTGVGVRRSRLIRPPNKTLNGKRQNPIMMQDFGIDNPLSVMVSVRVRGNEVQALVDTRACVKVLSVSFVRDIGCMHLLEPYSGHARTVDGSPLDIEGTIKTWMQVGDVVRTVDYLVAQLIQIPAILGLIFLITHQCTIEVHSRQFWTGRSRVQPNTVEGKQAHRRFHNGEMPELTNWDQINHIRGRRLQRKIFSKNLPNDEACG